MLTTSHNPATTHQKHQTHKATPPAKNNNNNSNNNSNNNNNLHVELPPRLRGPRDKLPHAVLGVCHVRQVEVYEQQRIAGSAFEFSKVNS